MRRSRQITILCILLLGLLCFPVKQAFAASNVVEVPLTVKQHFVVENAAPEMDFTGNYELCALDTEVPMPETAQDGKDSFSIIGEEAKTTLLLHYTHAGVYQYQLKQTTIKKEHYQYDKSHYRITVYVKNGEDGQLIPQVIVKKNGGKKCGELQFQNTYIGEQMRPSPSEKPENSVISNKPVKTGDNTHLMLYLLSATMSLLLMLFLIRRKKCYQAYRSVQCFTKH